MENVEREPEFPQVCVWEGKVVGLDGVADFEAFMMREFGIRVQYLEEIQTDPEFDDDYRSRTDLFFAVHDDDIIPFAYPRASAGIRWLEDVLSDIKFGHRIYPERVFDYHLCSNDEGYEECWLDDDHEDDEGCWLCRRR